MTSQINTYEDMLKEQEGLEALLHAQKELVIYDFKQLKEEFKPATRALNLLGKVTTRDSSGNMILTEASNKIIDFVLKKVILARAGWIARITLPFFLKNYSSHFVNDKKDKLMNKVFSWVGKSKNRMVNGKAAPETPAGGE